MTQFIDLSIPITNDVISDPEVMRPKVTYMTHQDTWQQIAMFFPGLEKDDLPDGEGWAVEMLELSTHNGTHMDAPWHFHSTTDDGAAPAPSIDEAPLDRFMRPGVKLDFSHLPHGHVVSATELEAAFEAIDYELQPLDIVLIQSGAVYGTDNFIDQGVGLGVDHDDHRQGQQGQAHHHESGHRPALEREVEGTPESRLGGLGHPHVCTHRHVHADETRGCTRHRADHEANRIPDA